MSIRFLFSAAIALASITVAGTAFADVTITQSTGTAMIQQGKTFVALDPAQVLQPGDQLVVPEGSSLSLQFPDGTTVTIPGGNTFTVPGLSAKLVLVPISAGNVAATGTAAAVAGGIVSPGLAVGIIAALGSVGYVVVDHNNRKDGASSP